MFHFAIVVNRNGSTAHIDTATNIAVPDILQVWQLGSFSHMGIFYLYKIPHLYIIPDHRIGPQVIKGSHLHRITHLTVMGIDELNMRSIPHFYIGKTDLGTNFTVFSYFRIAFQPGKRIQNCIPSHLDTFFHKGAIRIHYGNPFIHKASHNPRVHDFLGCCQLPPGIYPHHHVKIIGSDAGYFATTTQAFCQNIRQVILSLGIIIFR